MSDTANPGGPGTGTAVERASGAIGRRLDTTARAIRRGSAPDGTVGSRAAKLADGLERLGSYLEHTPPRTMWTDVEAALSKRPIQASLIGFVGAFLLGRRMSRRVAAR